MGPVKTIGDQVAETSRINLKTDTADGHSQVVSVCLENGATVNARSSGLPLHAVAVGLDWKTAAGAFTDEELRPLGEDAGRVRSLFRAIAARFPSGGAS